MPRAGPRSSHLEAEAGREQAADAIADRALDLARLARAHDLDALAGYLDMAILEAHRRARRLADDEPASAWSDVSP